MDFKNKINSLKGFDSIYIIGHDNIDADSYFSSYILSKILNSFGINSYFTILDNYKFSFENKEIINDYLKIKPLILNTKEMSNKNFILVDHNDVDQSLKNNNCNILFAIDHHIDSKKLKECYSKEYTSTLLYIYDIFKDIYSFSLDDKILIALSVIMDSEYLTTSRFKESDKKIYNKLDVNIDPKEIQKKYFKTTDFSLALNYNINSNYKFYNIENLNINRVILKGYYKDRKYIDKYLSEFSKLYDNTLFIWNEYDTLRTLVYFNSNLVKEYDNILTSSVLIIKSLIRENRLKKYIKYKK